MLFQININVQNVIHTRSCETMRGFLKTERKSRIDYQYIMWGINKLCFVPSSFHIKNEYSAYDELE